MYRLKVQHILYLIAVVFGVIGFLNFQSSMRTSSYEKVSGYITDVEETSELTKAGYKPRYNYIIHWFRDGEEYQRAVYEALSEPDESATEFWASLDNTDAIASEPAGIRTEAYLNWLVAALSAILGGMIDARNTRKTGKNRSRRRDERENAQILWSVVAFCMAIGVAITGFSLWISYRDGYYINSVMKDLLLVFCHWIHWLSDRSEKEQDKIGVSDRPGRNSYWKIVGSTVGGVVGNGVSIAMNVDLDGDGETGKEL